MAAPAAVRGSEATGASPVGLPPRRLMSPLGYATLAVLMAVTAVVVYFVTRSFQDAGPRIAFREAHEEIELGTFTRDLAADRTGYARDQFVVRVVLLLNPAIRDASGVKAEVEKRRNLLKHVVMVEVINPKSDAELRNPLVLESLGVEIRQKLNASLGGAKDEQEVIHKVLFPDVRLPIPR